jgi:monothiol glutaredoxin
MTPVPGRRGRPPVNPIPSAAVTLRAPSSADVSIRSEPMDTNERIRRQVADNPIVLYMKGTPDAPMCGFSATAVQILEACGVEEVATVNVLEDPEIRQGIKEFSNWPTIPQLYVNGEFVGGADILREMYQSGELKTMLDGVAKPA